MDRLTAEDYRALEIKDVDRQLQELADKKVEIKDLNSRMDTIESKLKEYGHVLTTFQILLVKENDRLREENNALKKAMECKHG